MNTVFTKSTDTAHKITIDSNLIYAIWVSNAVYADCDAVLEIKTSFVGDGAPVKITVKTEKGKKVAALDTKIFGNRLTARVPIPANIEPDTMVYFEAKLPRHNLAGESNLIPTRARIVVKKMGWSATEARRGDILTLSTEFQGGVTDGTEGTIIIYDHDQDGNHDPIAKIPAVVKQGKIEIQWEYEYHEDTDEIPTEEELQKYGRHYNPPEYFFVVVIDGVRIGSGQESGLLRFADHLELELRDSLNRPLADRRFTLALSDGSRKSGVTDSSGKARFDDVAPGPYTIEVEGIEGVVRDE